VKVEFRFKFILSEQHKKPGYIPGFLCKEIRGMFLYGCRKNKGAVSQKRRAVNCAQGKYPWRSFAWIYKQRLQEIPATA
jgi:hypothetical protein